MEDSIQASFHQASLQQIQTCEPAVTSPAPLPREITTVFRFSEPLLSSIEALQTECREIAPNLFYYPRNQMHLTIVGGLSLQIDLDVYESVIKDFSKKGRFAFRFWGTGMGKYSSSLSAYPIDFSIHELRSKLRDALGISGTDFTIHLQEYEYVGWINFARNVDSVPNEEFRSLITQYCERDFGTFSPIAIDCLENESWVLDPLKSKIIKRIEI